MFDLLDNIKQQLWVKALLQKGNVYLVGGCVRDSYLNKPIKDVDLVVEGLSMHEIRTLLSDFGKINAVGESFVVLKFKPFGHTGEDFDIAIPRVDRKIGIGHKGFETITNGVDIYGDLKRRDFTVNSIAIDIRTSKVIDPFYGREDLKKSIIRATDTSAFVEDALRILRAIQFASRFHFEIEPTTLSMMKEHKHLLSEISGERILMELDKILKKHGDTKIAFELLYKSDIDVALFGKKFIQKDFSGLRGLDMVSFYYLLGLFGGVVPSKFYKEKLKGEFPIFKALLTLEKYYERFGENHSELENKWNVFQMLKTAPSLEHTQVLPQTAWKVINDMKSGLIPMKMGDIPVSGNDVMDKFGVSGTDVGNIINKMYQDALLNKFNWKDKTKTLKYLENV